MEIGPKVPIPNILMDGTGVPVRTAVCSSKPAPMSGVIDSRSRIHPPMLVGAIKTAERFGKRL